MQTSLSLPLLNLTQLPASLVLKVSRLSLSDVNILTATQALDYAAELEDDVPVVAEGTTFNIHGGRDMFAMRSPAKKTEKSSKLPIAKKPSLERIALARNLQKQLSNESPNK